MSDLQEENKKEPLELPFNISINAYFAVSEKDSDGEEYEDIMTLKINLGAGVIPSEAYVRKCLEAAKVAIDENIFPKVSRAMTTDEIDTYRRDCTTELFLKGDNQ